MPARTSRKPPTDYLKQFYYDTVNFDPNALMLAVQFAGADHILAGSDYPHQIGSIPKMKAALESLPLPADQKAGILGGNARASTAWLAAQRWAALQAASWPS